MSTSNSYNDSYDYSYEQGSGPAYPVPPSYGSNAIGRFSVGYSPVGDIAAFDFVSTVISQYANSPRLFQLIQNYFNYMDQTYNFDQFYDLVWNIATAKGWGLDVWGRIVSAPRVIRVEVGTWFGFVESGTSFTFGQGSFYSNDPITENYSLPDPSYRLLILAKAATNISNGSIKDINKILMSLFPNRGNAYVREGGDFGYFGFAEATNALTFGQGYFYQDEAVPYMTFSYVFNFALSAVELAIVQTPGILPKPTGVAASVVVEI